MCKCVIIVRQQFVSIFFFPFSLLYSLVFTLVRCKALRDNLLPFFSAFHLTRYSLLIYIVYIIMYLNTIHRYSGITSGRVLDGELLYTKILEVKLFAFAYRLFHEDFSSTDGTSLFQQCSFVM